MFEANLTENLGTLPRLDLFRILHLLHLLRLDPTLSETIFG
jgi:hypothetical protein